MMRSRHTLRLAILTIAVLGSQPSPATAQITDLIVFGDSLSDIGNVRSKSFGFAAANPYVNGRLTNGGNYVDYLAPLLGLSPPTFSENNGTIYAHGGAQIATGSSFFIDSLEIQANDYLASVSGVADPEAVYIVFGGGNDVRDTGLNIADAALDLVGIVDRLLAAGANRIVVPNVPDLGLTPEVTEFGQGAGSASTARSLNFNTTLSAGLEGLQADDRILPFDLFELFGQVVADVGGSQFGITNVTDDCWEGGPSGLGFGDPFFGAPYSICANPDEYLFWDILHPTTVTHELLAQRMADVIVQSLIDIDFNDDGMLNCADVDGLVAAIVSGSNQPQFDLTGDALVDNADLDAWLSEAGESVLGAGQIFLPGDANLDGAVDVADFDIWNAHRFQAGQFWCGGDFDADGATDISDFHRWNENRLLTPQPLAVPEPAWGSVGGGMLIMLLWLRIVRFPRDPEA